MIAPLAVLVYCRVTLASLQFLAEKKCLTEMVLLGGRDVFENPAGYTDKQEIT